MELSWEVGLGFPYMVDSGLQQRIRYLSLLISSLNLYRNLISPCWWLWITHFPETLDSSNAFYLFYLIQLIIFSFECTKYGIICGCLSHGSLLPPLSFYLIVACHVVLNLLCIIVSTIFAKYGLLYHFSSYFFGYLNDLNAPWVNYKKLLC